MSYHIIARKDGEVLRQRSASGITKAREVFSHMVSTCSHFPGAYVIATDESGNEVDLFASKSRLFRQAVQSGKEVKHGDSVERPASQTPSSD